MSRKLLAYLQDMHELLDETKLLFIIAFIPIKIISMAKNFYGYFIKRL